MFNFQGLKSEEFDPVGIMTGNCTCHRIIWAHNLFRPDPESGTSHNWKEGQIWPRICFNVLSMRHAILTHNIYSLLWINVQSDLYLSPCSLCNTVRQWGTTWAFTRWLPPCTQQQQAVCSSNIFQSNLNRKKSIVSLPFLVDGFKSVSSQSVLMMAVLSGQMYYLLHL